jgi:membrane-associated phospholipid phosphatase
VPERVALTLGLLVFFVAGYFGVGLAEHAAGARSLATPLDARIPFIASTIWIYAWMFTAAFVPVFVVRCPRLFRRTAAAYAAAIAVSLVFFAFFPVTSAGLRVSPDRLDVTRFTPWAVSVLYRIDPPYNLFPSLHLSIAVLAALASFKAARRLGAAMFAGVALVAVSVCTVKQHFVLDVAGGVALAAAAHAVFLRPYQPLPGAVTISRRGAVAYAGAVTIALAGLYAAFRLTH